MNKISKIILSILLITIFVPILSVKAEGNAIMKLTTAKNDYYVGDMVYIDIMVEPNGEILNTVRAIINFTGKNVLHIDDFNLGSAFPYKSPGEELNNETNYINVGGFVLVDTVTTGSKFGTLIFKAQEIGSSTITFSESSHLISFDQQEKINLAGCKGITINVIDTPPPPLPQPVNKPPIFEPVKHKQINLGESVNFRVSASDPESDLVNLIWEIPTGANFSNIVNNAPKVGGDFSWTPENQGIFNAIFTAIDINGNVANLIVSIGVSVPPLPPAPINRPPVFEPVAEKIVNAGETLVFNVSATDPDGDRVNISLEPLETATLTPIITGVTTTSRFSWTPQNFGIYYAVFKAQDDNINPLTGILIVKINVFGGECPPCDVGPCPICQCEKEEVKLPEIEGKPVSVISSPTHPSQDKWYANNKPQFSWQVPDKGLGYYFNLNETPLTDLDYGYFYSQNNFFSFTEIADGFWYFHLKVKYDEGWGPLARYQIKIDTTPPEFFHPSLEQNKLFFSALDKHAGLAYYEMKIDEGEWQKVNSPLDLSEIWNLGRQLTLRAVDKAGNAIESYVDLEKKEVLDEEEQKTYVLEEVVIIIAPPLIESVSFEKISNKFIIENYLLVTGQAAPNSLITVYLSTEPETIFYAQTDANGYWQAKLQQELEAKKYSLHATATLDDQVSLPTEKIYFSLVEKFIPKTEFRLPGWIIWLIIILIILLLLLRNIFLKKKLKNTRSLLKKSKNKP
ncbi:MAG TPA: hypothetical protein ENN28_01965 [Candidatus Uhrbacteria bacterium]|nr:hypothetical protein [Candidatus Uhrbacteria bacterium]